MNHQQFLRRLGLTAHESSVYVALLEYGTLGVSGIAQITGLYRTVVYETLPNLIREGLVSVSLKGKYKVYVAESPKKLEAKFLELSNSFDEELLALEELRHDATSCRPIIKYTEGVDAIRAINDDVVTTLKKGEIYYRYSSAKVTDREWRSPYLSKKYRVLRDQKGLERKVITNVPNRERKTVRLEREIKVVPPDFDLFEYNVSQIIYGNKVAVIDYNTETAVIIENPIIARFQQKIFELLFRKL